MRFIAALILACALASPVMAKAVAVTPVQAQTYVDKVASDVLATVRNSKMNNQAKAATLESVFTRVVDIPFVAKFVLGRHVRTATPVQMQRYLKSYEPFLIKNYVSRITKYSGQTYKIMGSRMDADGSYVVSMSLLDPNGPSVAMDYRLRYDANQFKVIDIVVEGVSLLTTQRSEFNAVISNKGLDALMDALDAKTKAALAKAN
jgi:phospholipid transport system substrate-binding protein